MNSDVGNKNALPNELNLMILQQLDPLTVMNCYKAEPNFNAIIASDSKLYNEAMLKFANFQEKVYKKINEPRVWLDRWKFILIKLNRTRIYLENNHQIIFKIVKFAFFWFDIKENTTKLMSHRSELHRKNEQCEDELKDFYDFALQMDPKFESRSSKVKRHLMEYYLEKLHSTRSFGIMSLTFPLEFIDERGTVKIECSNSVGSTKISLTYPNGTVRNNASDLNSFSEVWKRVKDDLD